MKMTRKVLYCCLLTGLLAPTAAPAQLFEGFRAWYPVGDDADIHYKTSYLQNERIVFEANPIVRYSLLNNMRAALAAPGSSRAAAAYLAFKPQFRMYDDASLPVKMPSYRAQLGGQYLFKLKSTDDRADLLSVALESGHYSNGQAGAAFSEQYRDGSTQADSLYGLITDETRLSDILNRRDGNFSTNLTELHLNYRRYRFATADQTTPREGHAANLSATLYHDRLLFAIPLGGYSENDIRLYGRWRFGLGYEYTRVFTNAKPGSTERSFPRLTLSEKVELISGAHPSVNPFRSETRAAFTPGGRRPVEVSFFLGFVYGHDNYNYRFVDSGGQFLAGLSWTVSPPPNLARRRPADAAEDGGLDEE